MTSKVDQSTDTIDLVLVASDEEPVVLTSEPDIKLETGDPNVEVTVAPNNNSEVPTRRPRGRPRKILQTRSKTEYGTLNIILY